MARIDQPRSVSVRHVRAVIFASFVSIKLAPGRCHPRRVPSAAHASTQQGVAAAQAEGMEVVPEGGSLYQMDISLIQDGNSTLEPNLPVARACVAEFASQM